MPLKLKIFFILPSLRAGGAERVMSFLAQNINPEHFESYLIITGSSKDQTYAINNNTNLIFLDKKKVRNSIFSLAKLIKKYKPNIVMGAIGHVNIAISLLAPFFKNTIFIGRETTITTAKKAFENDKSKRSFISNFPKYFLDTTICQSGCMKQDFIANLNYPSSKIKVINNPVTSNFKLKKKSTEKSVLKLITIGRLVSGKGHQRILEILRDLNIEFKYTIIGDGEEKENILKYINENGLEKKVKHIQHTKKVEDFLSENDLMLSGSYFEGFPNVFLESCAVGTPVLTYNAPGGINEIIIDGLNGYVVNNQEEFKQKLLNFEPSHWDPKKIRDSVISRYSEETILEQYEDLFRTLVANN